MAMTNKNVLTNAMQQELLKDLDRIKATLAKYGESTLAVSLLLAHNAKPITRHLLLGEEPPKPLLDHLLVQPGTRTLAQPDNPPPDKSTQISLF